MDSSVYPNKDVIAASKLCVNIFCNNETDHNAKKKYGNEEWCEENYGQICDEHVKNHNQTSSLFFNGTIPNPTTILCDPDGKELSRKKGAATAQELADMIKEAAKKVGPGITQDEFQFRNDKFKAADEAVKANKIKDAVTALTAVTKQFGKSPSAKKLADQAQAKLDELNTAGQTIVDNAKADAAAGKVDDARKALKDVYANYKGLECSKAAEKAMAELPKDK